MQIDLRTFQWLIYQCGGIALSNLRIILLAQILSGKDVSSRYLVLCTCAAPQRRMGATASIEDEGGVADDKDYDKDSDKVVIQELYDCTQGAFWHNYSGWGTGAHVRSW